MTDPEKFEKKLDKDFLFFVGLTRDSLNYLDSEDQDNCKKWLTRLCGSRFDTINSKCDRNIYLSRLLLQMQNGSLQGIFLDEPPAADLSPAFEIFGLPKELQVKTYENIGFQVDESAAEPYDLFEASRDGRTYLATRKVRNGLMAFMAFTITEDEPLWYDQRPIRCKKSGRDVQPTRFVQCLVQFEDKCGLPISHLRKSPEDREKMLRWLDKVIESCGKWLKGEDPKDMDLEELFQQIYKDYKENPDKCEIFRHPKYVRNILIRDIRDRLYKRRKRVVCRERLLDQYEAQQYSEKRLPTMNLDKIWFQLAEKPLDGPLLAALERTYPKEVVERFLELLMQERLLMIEKRYADASRKIDLLKNKSVEAIKLELQKLKKIQLEYKDLYCIFKEIETYHGQYKMDMERCAALELQRKSQQHEKRIMKKYFEKDLKCNEILYQKEKTTQAELAEAIVNAKQEYLEAKERLKEQECRHKKEREDFEHEKSKLASMIKAEERKIEQLKEEICNRCAQELAKRKISN